MVKRRRTLKVSPETLNKLIKLQGQIQAKSGKKVSLTEIAKEIIDGNMKSQTFKFGIRFD